MDNFDINAITIIKRKLTAALSRDLTAIEDETFSIRRSGIAYEMMDDYIKNKSKDEVEDYVKAVVDEYLRLTDKN